MYKRMKDRFNPPPLVISQPAPSSSPVAAQLPPALPASSPSGRLPEFDADLSPAVLNGRPVSFSGCVRQRDVCRCFDTSGGEADKSPELCEASGKPGDTSKEVIDFLGRVEDVTSNKTIDTDLSLVGWVNQDRQIPYFAK
jgi:hypothetical protein